MGEKRKALKYIFTFTSANRGLERNLSRSAFFMSFSLIACTRSGGKEQEHDHQWDEHKLLEGQRRAAWSGEKAQSQLWGESQCAAPTWELLTFYSLYLLGAGEGNTKRRAKVQIKCKTQIQKVESHYRHSHLRTLDFYLLELTLATTNTNTSSTSDQNMSTVCVLVTF